MTIGGNGRPVTGRVVLDGTPEAPVDWTANEPVMLGVPAEGSDQKRFGMLFFGRSLFASYLDKDGRFRIDDVPAGKYELELAVQGATDPRFAGSGREIGRLKMSVSVPEMPGGRANEPLDLGTITAILFDIIKIGDVAPDFDVERHRHQRERPAAQVERLSREARLARVLGFLEPVEGDRPCSRKSRRPLVATHGSR